MILNSISNGQEYLMWYLKLGFVKGLSFDDIMNAGKNLQIPLRSFISLIKIKLGIIVNWMKCFLNIFWIRLLVFIFLWMIFKDKVVWKFISERKLLVKTVT